MNRATGEFVFVLYTTAFLLALTAWGPYADAIWPWLKAFEVGVLFTWLESTVRKLPK